MLDLTIDPALHVYRTEKVAVARRYNSHEEDALDEALASTFPSSDPVAISITCQALRKPHADKD